LRPSLRRVRPFHLAAGALTTTASLGAAALAAAQADTQSAPVPMIVSDAHLHFGQKLVASGQMAAATGRRVQLQFQPNGGAWTVLAQAPVGSDGRYRVAAKPRTSGVVRVVTAPDGTVASVASQQASGAQPVTVAARIVTRHRNVDVLGGHRGVLRGRVLPGVAGRTVTVATRRHGAWRTLGHARTHAGGRFRLVVHARGTGSSPLRVAFAGDGANTGTHRRAGRLNVYRPSLASWYSLSGGHLACGGTMTAGTLGVANKSLPCGTMVTFRYRGRSVRVPVVDRGPYSGGREWDLSAATARALGFGGVGTVWATA
jgi:rare lipoprotein A